jgi:hypothetical protein
MEDGEAECDNLWWSLMFESNICNGKENHLARKSH